LSAADAGNVANAGRIEWVDDAKGIGIVLVVFGHLLSSAFHAGVAVDEKVWTIVDSTLYGFHMPLFFFLAGLFARQSLARRGSAAFVRGKFVELAYPYALWSVIQGLVEWRFGGAGRGPQLGEVIAFPWLPREQYWYLYALLLMYLVYVPFAKAPGRWQWGIAAAAVVLFILPLQTPWFGLAGFSVGLVFFLAGSMLVDRVRAPRLGRLASASLAGLGFLALALAGSALFGAALPHLRLSTGMTGHPGVFAALALVGVAASLCLAWALQGRSSPSLFAYIGRRSLPVYLAHMIPGAGARLVAMSLFGWKSPAALVLLSVLAGIAGPILLFELGEAAGVRFLFRAPGRHVD
jgi:fucose 4-O-acetylase-like acetyltransferase